MSMMETDLERNDKEIPLISAQDQLLLLNDEEKNDQNLKNSLETSGMSGYKDVFFLFLFIVNLVVLGTIALTYGGVSLFNSHAEYWIVQSNGSEYMDHNYDNVPLKFLTGLFFILMSSTLLSVGWIYLLSQVASLFLNFVIISMTAGTAFIGFVVLFLGYPYFACSLVFLALGILAISYLYQNRLEFASVNLQIACKAILAVPATLHYSLYLTSIQAAFLIVWAVAAVGFATNSYHITKTYQGKTYNLDECSTYKYSSDFTVDGVSLTCSSGNCYSCICGSAVVSSSSPCFTPKVYYSTFIFLVLSLFWVCAVISNVVHCTTSSAVYSWWRNGQCSDESLKNSFERITTKSFGSICFGSLLTAIVRTVRSFLHFISARAKPQSNGPDSRTVLAQLNRISHAILLAFTEVLDRMILYFNRYAFCFVALYGVSYLDAAKAAVDLFKARGLSTLFNDDIIDLVILVSEVIISITCLVIAYIYARVAGITGAYLYLFEVSSVVMGYVMSVVILSTLQSAVTTVYVGFARNSSAFEVVHPTLYASLANAWIKVFPGCLNLSETRNLKQESNYKPSATAVAEPTEPAGRTVRGTYNPPEMTFPKNSASNALYSSVFNMVQPSRSGYEKLPTTEDEVNISVNTKRNVNHWGGATTSAVTSLGLAIKDLAKDPFGLKPIPNLPNQKGMMEDSYTI